MGTFGGLGEKRNTGAAQKNIPLFTANEGTLSYSPSLEYFSNGVRVDDWGGRVGISWNENITAVITRVARGVADEVATDRVGDGQSEFGTLQNPDTSQASVDKMYKLSLSASSARYDGEYDLFSYNIFGLSGNFIIKNNLAILLNHKEGIKIQVLATSPTYKFVITANNGTNYYFNSTIEYTNYSTENQCDQDQVRQQAVATAWFVDKMVSVNNETVNFTYNPVHYSYIYDYSESYSWHDVRLSNPCEDPAENSHTVCSREKTTTTYFLTSVQGRNFNVSYDYVPREDLVGDKLLSKILLSTGSGALLKQIELKYDKIISTTPIEDLLTSVIQTSEQQQIKIRYFLSAIKTGTSAIPNNYVYNFNYLNLSSLPHRFSFSQDYMGYFNGKSNVNFVPDIAKETMNVALNQTPPQGAFANRRHNNVGKTGLLYRIKYPTGGIDSIIYEPNTFQVVQLKKQPAPQIQGDRTNTGSKPANLVSANITVPFDQDIKLTLHCYHADNPNIVDEEGEYYNVETTIWDKTNNGAAIGDVIKLKLNESFSYPNVRVSLLKNRNYELRFYITGNRTKIAYTIDYISSQTNIKIDTPFFGYRLKKVYTKSGHIPSVKSYNYNLLNQLGSNLSLTDSTSIVTSFKNYYWTTSLFWCEAATTYGTSPHGVNTLSSKANYNDYIFNGSSYAYKNVTEFLDENNTSFVASEYVVTSNSQAGSVYVEYPASLYNDLPLLGPELSNSAWDSGLEIKKYFGTVKNGSLQLIKEQHSKFSGVSSQYSNYSAYRLIERTAGSGPDNVRTFRLKAYENYSTWFKLDSLKEINYFYGPTGNQSLTTTEKYRYNPVDKLLEEKELLDSRKNVKITRMYHPAKMVALGRDDASGTYQGMVNNNIIDPTIEESVFYNNNQISLVKTNYSNTVSIFNKGTFNFFLPINIMSQRKESDAMETRLVYNKYDNSGNVLAAANTLGPNSCFVWGYGGNYLIAKVENADYDILMNALGGESAIEAFRNKVYPTDQDIFDFLNPAKNNIALKNAAFSIYTHRPLLGLGVAIDAKGYKTSFEYDSFGYLDKIKDNDGDITQSYSYNYSNHNDNFPVIYGNEERVKSFVRYNCAAALVGGNYTYTVPAGKYISTSTEAANMLADAEVEANGQNLANTSAGCIASPDSFHFQLLVQNGLSQSIPMTIIYNEEATSSNVNISPGTSNLGIFAQAGGYSIEIPYMEKLISGQYHFFWNCTAVDPKEWKLVNGKMRFDTDVEFTRQDCPQIKIVP